MQDTVLDGFVNFAVGSRHPLLHFLFCFRRWIHRVLVHSLDITLRQGFYSGFIGLVPQAVALRDFDALNCRLNICHSYLPLQLLDSTNLRPRISGGHHSSDLPS